MTINQVVWLVRLGQIILLIMLSITLYNHDWWWTVLTGATILLSVVLFGLGLPIDKEE